MNQILDKASARFPGIRNLPLGHEHLFEPVDLHNNRHVTLSLLFIVLVVSVNILIFTVVHPLGKKASAATTTQTAVPYVPYQMKVLSLRYFPVDSSQASGSAQLLDATTSAVPAGTTVDSMRARVDDLRNQMIGALTEATKYHGYKDSNAVSALQYSILDEKEFLKPIPKSTQFVPTADHFKVLNGTDSTIGINNICDYVENKGVKEVWIWMYHTYDATHTNGVAPAESNMAPKTGGQFGTPGYQDLSNSDQVDDLPRCAKTYSVFDLNYNRGTSLHGFGHHLERVMTYADPDLWKKFTTPDATLGHCGLVHWPPNERIGDHNNEYIYNSTTEVWSDCQNWRPEGGQGENVSCVSWIAACASVQNAEFIEQKEHIWWMQNIPGVNNGLSVAGIPMRSWWDVVGDFDNFPSKPVVGGLSGVSKDPNTITLTANASDPAAITRVEFFVNGVLKSSVTNAPYTIDIAKSGIPFGNNSFYVIAYSTNPAFGNSTTSTQVSFNNDLRREPIISVISPRPNEVLKSNKVTFHFDLANIDRVNIDVEGMNPYSGQIASFDLTPTNSSYTVSLADGSYYLNIISKLNGALYPDVSANHIGEYRFVVSADTDLDGFTDSQENTIGTDPQVACGVTAQGKGAWPPDANNDKTINSTDLFLISQHYGPKTSPNYVARYDVNADGTINSLDYQIIASRFGKKCTDTSVHPILAESVPAQRTCNIPDLIPGAIFPGGFFTKNDAYLMDANNKTYFLYGDEKIPVFPVGQYTAINSFSDWVCDRKINVLSDTTPIPGPNPSSCVVSIDNTHYLNIGITNWRPDLSDETTSLYDGAQDRWYLSLLTAPNIGINVPAYITGRLTVRYFDPLIDQYIACTPQLTF